MGARVRACVRACMRGCVCVCAYYFAISKQALSHAYGAPDFERRKMHQFISS